MRSQEKMIEPDAQIMGTVFAIQHYSIHDGPGIRTVVFLKGCNMRCEWCHNPESIAFDKEMMYIDHKCISCAACADVCPQVHRFKEGKHIIYRKACVACGKCTEACPSGALSVVGYNIDAKEIISKVLRDQRYYRTSGGGLTISGGEPSCQPSFVEAILTSAKENGVHTAIETNGYFEFDTIEPMLSEIDLFLFDYKATDCDVHCRTTGVGNKRVLTNLARLCAMHAQMILRCPIIPGVNDNDAHFEAIANLTRRYVNILGFELMPYHKLGMSKAAGMGQTPYTTYEEPSKEAVLAWRNKVLRYGGREWSDTNE